MVQDTNRRWRTSLAGAGLLVLLLGSSACSSGGTHDGDGSSSSGTPSVSSSASADSPSASASAEPSEHPSPSPTTPAPTPSVVEESPTPEPSGTVSSAPAEGQPSESEPSEQSPSSNPASPNPSAPQGAKDSTCGDGALKVAIEESGNAAGSTDYNLTFTNSGSDSCKLSGYPTVNFIDGSGQVIGPPAMQATELPGNGATLEPGGSTSAVLRSTQPGLYGETCQKTSASGLRVAAPGSGQVLDVSFPMSACANQSVQQLSVSKVGVQR